MTLFVKLLSAFLFFISLTACSSVEFVYNNKNNISKYKKNTTIVALDNQSEYLISYLSKKLENTKESNEYTLNISSQLIESMTSTNQDQSAASYYINSIVKYELINNFENCTVYLDTIETGFSYNTKSEGYSFGTERSIEKNTKQNLEQNAEVFLKQISSLSNNKGCINENKA